MGFWDFIYSSTETVKRNVPDLKPVKEACKTSYGYGSAAFWKIDSAVRVNGLLKLKDYMSDEQGRAQITHIASKLAQNTAEYAFKESYNLVPGGKAIGKIVTKTVNDVKSESRRNKRDMEAAILASEKTSGTKNVLDRAEMQSKAVQFGYQKGISADSAANQAPEDVLRIFMMKEFIGTRFLDDLIIPQKRNGKEHK